ncbi:MAG: ferrochelatase [Crocinitomix sp.]|jgi:ferrochelatase
MNQKKTCVLLINLGTPDSPKTRDVRTYLTEFLNDPRVIDINAVGRAALVNGIIVPLRAPKSAKIYQELWDLWDGESPLLTFGKKLRELVQAKFDPTTNVKVEFAMRYKNPSLNSVLKRIEAEGYDRIVVMPLFPHYASSSTGSAIEKTLNIIRKWWVIPELKVIQSFYDHPGYIAAFVDKAKQHNLADYDHVLFSYHGLPERQIDKVHPTMACNTCNCDKVYKTDQRLCYRNACYETTRLIANSLGLSENEYTVAFQSRLGKTPWLQPYSDKVVEDLAKAGKKKVLAFSAAFVSDCLETSIEIGVEYQEIFEEHGGEKIQLVESLNDSEKWVNTVHELILDQL